MHNSETSAVTTAAKSTPPTRQSGGNVASIQFLRFVAASLVVFWHSIEALSQHFVGSVPSSFLKAGIFGASGVHIFFVISGFIMVYTSFYKDKDGQFLPSAFLSRRIIRIYPIYLVYCALFIGFYHTVTWAPFLRMPEFVGALLLLPGYSSRIIGPGWTLGFEVYFYLCFSIAMVLGLRKGILALTSFFLMSMVSRLFIDASGPVAFVLTNSLLIEFLIGAWIGYAVVAQVPVSGKLASAMLVAAFAGFAAGMIFGFDLVPSVFTWGIPSALLIAGSVALERVGRVPMVVRRMSFLGDSSYSLYLLHVLLIDAAIFVATQFIGSIANFLGPASSAGILLMCSALTVYCTIVALVSYVLVERNLITGLRALQRRGNAWVLDHRKER